MRIITTRKGTPAGASQIVAKGMGKQKTTNVDLSKSNAWNHGTAAANLIIHVNESLHPLTRQNADDLRVSAVRSIDHGYSTHDSSEDGQRHVFDV